MLASAIKPHGDYKVPNTIKQAVQSDQVKEWATAIKSELNSLYKNKTLTIMERPADRNIRVLGLKWVFKIKETAAGLIERLNYAKTLN